MILPDSPTFTAARGDTPNPKQRPAGLAAFSLLDGDALGEIPRLVHVRSLETGDVVGEELERDGGQDRGEVLAEVGDMDHVVDLVLDLGVSFGGDGDDLSVARAYLLEI